jgi:hypothetical protein
VERRPLGPLRRALDRALTAIRSAHHNRLENPGPARFNEVPSIDHSVVARILHISTRATTSTNFVFFFCARRPRE